ncbi:DUF1801 domain-containing protein [Massilia cavernae]|uniref:DUF1801 domain-containing protein n=1 Tax=Massilia cavernae TaxID=2320864 RepID=A0A418Y155_9BURK|nr:DUF1801 domain-containing protein [Massilia cavernae]RJG19186.1 DUF1801 domain-containing protein [Massilia cavernae]
MQSPAATISDYLATLPGGRRQIVEAVRNVIVANLDGGYAEGMQYGMIGYAVPHSIFPAGYHCDPKQPLPFAGLASQKNYVSLYLMGLYSGCTEENETDEVRWFRDAWAASGKKKLDMGKACVRFKKLDDVPLDVIGEAIRRIPAQLYIERYQAGLAAAGKGGRTSRKA